MEFTTQEQSNMTSSDLAMAVLKVLPDTSKAAAGRVVEALFSQVSSSLMGGQDVVIKDFGRFTAVQKEARQARNPRTGESVQVAPKVKIKFIPRGGLKSQLTSE